MKNNKNHNKRITQILGGVLMIILVSIIPIILDGDITLALFTIPFGLYLLFTKEIVDDEYVNDEPTDEEEGL